jgi:hypothetical protein
MRVLIVPLLLIAPHIAAIPANAVTFTLVGATISTCTSHVSVPGSFPPIEDPTPCIGKVGLSLDGTITLPDALGPLQGRQLNLWPDELPPLDGNGIPFPLEPNQTYLTNAQFGFGLNFDWGAKADHFAGLIFDSFGNIKTWFVGAVIGNFATETTSFGGTTISGPQFSASGPSGQFIRDDVPPSPAIVPLPASAWLLLAGLLSAFGLRRRAKV